MKKRGEKKEKKGVSKVTTAAVLLIIFLFIVLVMAFNSRKFPSHMGVSVGPGQTVLTQMFLEP